MPRPIPQQSEPVNSDSFLDIVASVVSIMIIMVVMEGARIKNTPVTVSIARSPVALQLEKDLSEEQAMRDDVMKGAEQIRTIEQETAHSTAERDILATVVSAVEHKIGQRREKLNTAQQFDFDLSRRLSECRFQLEQISQVRHQAENAPVAPVVIESYPTPISRAVDGPEAHLRVANGRVAFVPIAALLEQFQAQAKRQAYRLQSESELTDTVGPVDGFRLRYTLERHDVATEPGMRGGSFARLQKWALIPVSGDLGEPIRLALKPTSEFRQELKKILPGRTTITIWVYPDGFEAFRQLRTELYRHGYTIAARPLPPGAPISGSPEGSKSAAQ